MFIGIKIPIRISMAFFIKSISQTDIIILLKYYLFQQYIYCTEVIYFGHPPTTFCLVIKQLFVHIWKLETLCLPV